MCSYLSFQVLLVYLAHFLLMPCFKISWSEDSPTFEKVFINLGYFLSFMCIFNYLAVILLGAGHQAEINPNSDFAPVQCLRCPTQKFYGTHHCSVCDRCVPMMDHHCMWTNQCIGLRNRYIFVSLLLFGSLGCYWFVTAVSHSNFETYCMQPLENEKQQETYFKLLAG